MRWNLVLMRFRLDRLNMVFQPPIIRFSKDVTFFLDYVLCEKKVYIEYIIFSKLRLSTFLSRWCFVKVLWCYLMGRKSSLYITTFTYINWNLVDVPYTYARHCIENLQKKMKFAHWRYVEYNALGSVEIPNLELDKVSSLQT